MLVLISAAVLLLLLLRLVLFRRTSTASAGWQCSPPDLNRELRLAVFPAELQPRASAGSSVPRRTSTAGQKICQIERQKECQKICQKEVRNNASIQAGKLVRLKCHGGVSRNKVIWFLRCTKLFSKCATVLELDGRGKMQFGKCGGLFCIPLLTSGSMAPCLAMQAHSKSTILYIYIYTSMLDDDSHQLGHQTNLSFA